jgi:hypothetical protein
MDIFKITLYQPDGQYRGYETHAYHIEHGILTFTDLETNKAVVTSLPLLIENK